MEIDWSLLKQENTISILVNFPKKLKLCASLENDGFVYLPSYSNKQTVLEYLQVITKESQAKIKQALQLVKLKEQVYLVFLQALTNQEKMKVELAKNLLLQKNVIVCEHFFEDLIYSEREYFVRLFRNMIYKHHIAVVLLENDMNFVCETVKSFYLFTNNGKYKLIEDFYDDEIYKYVDMPFTVQLVKYFEEKGHQVDHDYTFNETLKAIYRAVK